MVLHFSGLVVWVAIAGSVCLFGLMVVLVRCSGFRFDFLVVW